MPNIILDAIMGKLVAWVRLKIEIKTNGRPNMPAI